MRTIPPGFLDSTVTDLQVCWKLVRRDSVEILGTEYDRDITITTGDYAGAYLASAGITGSDVRSTSDLSVDNLEITGALVPSTATLDTGDSSSSSLFLLDISPADIEAGLLDNAECVTFLVNSTAPDLYQLVLRSGWIGNVTRNSDQRWTTELRGLTQALSQGIVKTYGVGCQWELGSTPSTNPPGLCRVDMTPFTDTKTVVEVTNRREFAYGGTQLFPSTPFIVLGGRLTWTTGENSGYSMEVKEQDAGAFEHWLTLYLPMPRDIAVGDEFIFRAGCDKTHAMCLVTYNNIDNYGGWGVFVPGQFEILKVGKR